MNLGSEQREALEQAAVAWLLRVDAPEATEADWLALRAWLESAPEHREVYDRAERVSAELSASASALLQALDAYPVAPLPRRQSLDRRAGGRRPTGAQQRLWSGFAAAAAAAAALAIFVAVRPPAPAEIFQTAKGEDRVVSLADGSSLHLNTGSRIAVRLERGGRYVELTHGQVAFDVAHDPERPFLISAGERDIRVVGTEFDVLRHEGRLRVTVREGVVSVQAPEDGPVAEPMLLRAGDQLEHRPGERWTVRQVDPETALAWQGGDLVYRDQPLDEVVADLNRYFATPVQVVGPASSLRFSGVLRIDTEEAVVRRLQAFLPISADRGREGVTLRMRAAG